MVNILANLSKQSGKYKQRVEESAARILKMKYKSGILQVKNGDAIESDGEAGKANETAAAEN